MLNAFVPAGIIFAVNLPPPRHLIGGDDIVGALLKTAGIATFAMTIMLTWVIRLRLRKGGLPHCAWPRDDRGPYRIVSGTAVGLALTHLVGLPALADR